MFSRKKQIEEVPEQLTAIWQCTNDECNGWMREEFAFEAEPTCRQCASPMQRNSRMLPMLVNTSGDQRAIKLSIPNGNPG
ncbi:cold-shock protein [Paenibacillus sp. GYB003]|uniref:cold-shock protein n=1 Tax=Paenibacillus sp. GYB003 TaxID=2994392 RepID=UPI002F961A7F